jgi:hypothetical protein
MTTLKEFIGKYKNGIKAIQATIDMITKVDSELYNSLFNESSFSVNGGFTVNVLYDDGSDSFRIISLLSYGDVEAVLLKEDGKFVSYLITDEPLTSIQSRSTNFDWIDD